MNVLLPRGGNKMENIKIRSLLLYLLLLSFLFGASFFVYEYVTNAKIWSLNPINKHLSSGSAYCGEILDRNDNILARTVNGKRVYSGSENIRKALLHTVGDSPASFPSSVQAKYSSDLFGYNLISGFGTPKPLDTTSNIKLTFDSKVCEEAYKSLKGKKGAAIVSNYLTGEIICMVSTPSYDPSNKPDIKEISENDEYKGVYINRALLASYTPGSIFKIITAAAALNNLEDAEMRIFKCAKTKIIDGEKIVCMQNHGDINLKSGLAKSCNLIFSDIATELGKDKMTSEAEKLGFNKKFSVETINFSASKYEIAENSSMADLGWSGVGQYTVLVNPMHMLIIMSAIANKGIPVEPYFIDSITSQENGLNTQNRRHPSMERMLSETNADKIKDMMRYTAANNYGNKMFPNMKICAKTGTAEVSEEKPPHGWMVGFSQEKNFPFAFVVIVENSDFGIKSAGFVAANIMKSVYSCFS
jgi:peptidoglycan glycosyltransferase